MTNKTPLEIERKWMVNGFPDLPLLFSQQMRQGYIATHPTVRIREEKMIYSSKDQPLKDEFILCFKSSGLLTRKEIEMEIPEANAFDPKQVDLSDYLNDDVTNQPNQSMAAYWQQTRQK